MTAPTLLDIRAIAARLDLNERTVRNYHQQAVHNRSCNVHTPACRPKAGDFPEPDARFGGHPAWQVGTVDANTNEWPSWCCRPSPMSVVRPAVAPHRNPRARASAANQMRSPTRWKPNME